MPADRVPVDGDVPPVSSSPLDVAVTRLAIFNLPDANAARDFDVFAARYMIPGAALPQVLASVAAGDPPTDVSRILDLAGAGVLVVLTLNWTDGTPSLDQQEPLLSSVRELVRVVGPSIGALAVHNEFQLLAAQAASGPEPRSDGTYEDIEWMRRVAGAVRSEIEASPQTLGHLRVVSGAFTHFGRARRGTLPPGLLAFHEAAVRWVNSDPNIDFADVHLHVETLAELVEQAAFTDASIDLPLVSTEWSQAPVINPLGAPLPESFDTVISPRPSSRESYLAATYATPVPLEEWDRFVSLVGPDPQYIPDGFAALSTSGYRFVAYGQWRQYGEPLFDWKQVTLDRTVARSASEAAPENAAISTPIRALAQVTP